LESSCLTGQLNARRGGPSHLTGPLSRAPLFQSPNRPSPYPSRAPLPPHFTSPHRTWYRRRRTFSSEVIHSTSTKIQPMVPARLLTLPPQATSSVQNLVGEDWQEEACIGVRARVKEQEEASHHAHQWGRMPELAIKPRTGGQVCQAAAKRGWASERRSHHPAQYKHQLRRQTGAELAKPLTRAGCPRRCSTESRAGSAPRWCRGPASCGGAGARRAGQLSP